jgi:hypothetical protein
MQNLKINKKGRNLGEIKLQSQLKRKNIVRIEQQAKRQGIIILNMVKNGPSSEILRKLDECYSEILKTSNGKLRIETTYY